MTEKITAAGFIIGIDPDVDKSGFAVFQPKTGFFKLNQLSLWDIFDALESIDYPISVRLEGGWMIKKKNWHFKGGVKAANDVGRNHEIGRQIEKFCIEKKIDYGLVVPCGLSSIDHKTFCKITGWDIKKLTNPEKRVAGLLAFKPQH